MSDARRYETLGRETVYRGFSTVHRDRVRMPDGTTAEREVVEHTDAVAVVPVLDDGTVLLLRQYRHPVGRYVLEIPAGIMDVDGEDPADTGRRELVEEVGYTPGSMRHLVSFENSSGWCDEHTHVYLARDLRPAPRPEGFAPEAEEADMEVVRVPYPEALALAQAGDVGDAKTLVGLLLAASHIG